MSRTPQSFWAGSRAADGGTPNRAAEMGSPLLQETIFSLQHPPFLICLSSMFVFLKLSSFFLSNIFDFASDVVVNALM